MGVKGLWKLIKPCGHRVSLEQLRGKRVAIDMNIWLHQATKARAKGRKYCQMILYKRIARLAYFNIKPVFVFDGEVPLLKRQIIQGRRDIRVGAAKKADKIKKRLVKRLLVKLAEESLKVKKSPKKGNSAQEIVQKLSSTLGSCRSRNDQEDLFFVPEEPLLDASAKTDFGRDWDELAFCYLDNLADTYEDPEIGLKGESFNALPKPAQLRVIQLARLKMNRKLRYFGLESEDSGNYQQLEEASGSEFSKHQLDRMLRRRELAHKESEISSEMLKQESIALLNSLPTGEQSGQGTLQTLRIQSRENEHSIFINKLDPITAKKAVNDRLMAMLNPKKSLPTDETPTKIQKEEIPTSQVSSEESMSVREIDEGRPSTSAKVPKEEILREKILPKVEDEAKKVKEEIPIDSNIPGKETVQAQEEEEYEEELLTTANEKVSTSGSVENEEESPTTATLNMEMSMADIETDEAKEGDDQEVSSRETEKEVEAMSTETESDEMSFESVSEKDETEQVIESVSEAKEVEQEEEEVSEDDFQVDDDVLAQELETVNRQAQQVSDHLIEDAKLVAKMFGYPYVESPEEAEAQCAHLQLQGLVDLIATEDSDVWLFGASKVCRHLFGGDKDDYPTVYEKESVERRLGLTRSGFISLAMLCGSDYTRGVRNVGPVTAMEVISQFEELREDCSVEQSVIETLTRFKEWNEQQKSGEPFVVMETRRRWPRFQLEAQFPSETVAKAYTSPRVSALGEQELQWRDMNEQQIVEFLVKTFSWSRDYAQQNLDLIIRERAKKKPTMTKITYYFNASASSQGDPLASKRTRMAAEKILQKESQLKSSSPEKKRRNQQRKRKHSVM